MYLTLEGPTTVIHGVAVEILASRPGGGPVGILQSATSITVDATQTLQTQRLDLTKSLNFVLPPDWYAQGTLNFEIPSLSIGGERNVKEVLMSKSKDDKSALTMVTRGH